MSIHCSLHIDLYKVYLAFGRMQKFLSDNGTSFINKHWKNLTKALAFTHIQSSPRNPRANGRIKNMRNFLKRTMKRSDTVTKPSNGMKPSRSQFITTTHSPVLLMHIHHFCFTSAEIAAIDYGTNSIQETPS